MPDENDKDIGLSELSCHYDSLLWTVTSLWAAAIGGLLVYCSSNFKLSLSLIGLLLTVCAMAFAASFRDVRSRVLACMSENLAKLHRSRGMFRQWPWFLPIFLVLVVAWTQLLIKNRASLTWLWVILGIAASSVITWYWCAARGEDKKTDA